jgi:hypothetical protein
VRSAINGYRAWVEGLNQTKTFNPRNKIDKADVVGDAVGSKVNARENQTTADFVKESASIYDAIEQAVASGNPDAVAGIDLPEGMSAQLRPILQGGAQLSQIVTGLQSGEWAWVSDQNGTHPAPTAFDLQGNRVPVDASGNLINGTKVVVSIGGKPVEAFAQTQQVNVWSGGDVVTNDGTVLVRQGQMVTQADINAVADASKAGRLAAPVDAQNSTMSAESIVVAGEDGKPQLWFGSDGKWWQPMGKDKSVKPLPILAGSDRAASEIAAKMGLDPTAYYTLAKPPEGTQRKGGFQQSVEPGSKPQQQAQPLFPGLNLAPGRGASPLDTGRGAGGTFDAASAVQQFGLNLKPVIKKQGGFFENADLTTKLPGLGSPVNTRRGGFFQGADLTPVQPVAPIRIKPVNLNFDLPEPANIFNPNPTATGRKGGFLK